MRVLLQRVSYASVTVAGDVVGEIGRGFALLVGLTHTDSSAEVAWMAQKVATLRLFEDDQGKLNRSLTEVDGAFLVISQFTLYGNTQKGRRPSFIEAARPEHAQPLFAEFVSALQKAGYRVATGFFGADMLVTIHNDGPVTLWLEKESEAV